jgi:hypothetical protein
MVLDTLEILIEADASGLATQLKKATTSISSFVDQMNSQQINWTSILASTISPAIISGIASSFAIAISSAVNFQNAMTNVGNNTQDTMGQSTSQIDNAITGLAENTGQNLSDTASAYQAFNKLLNDSAGAQDATTAASQLAFAAHMSLNDVVKMLIPLFQSWNIQTGSQAVDAMTGLANAAGKGQFTLSGLVDTLEKGGQVLSKNTDISTTAFQIQDLSTKAGESVPKVQAMFDEVVKDANNAQSPLTLMVGGIEKVGSTIAGEGVIGAIRLFGDRITSLGPIAAASLGIVQTSFDAFGTTNKKVTDQVEADTPKWLASLQSLGALEEQNITTTQKFEKAWNKLATVLGAKVGIPVLDYLTQVMGGLSSLITDPAGTLKDFIQNPNITGPTGTTSGGDLLNKAISAFSNPGGLVAGLAQNSVDSLLNTALPKQQTSGASGFATPGMSSVPGAGTTFQNTFNITAAPGESSITSSKVNTQLYNQFQNTH